MTDRIVAVLVEHKKGKVFPRHEEALGLLYAVDSATLVDDCVLLIFDHIIRTDDFEMFDDALDLFGFTIKERIIHDGSLSMLRSSAISGARLDMINDHVSKKPILSSNSMAYIRQYIIDMAGWSYIMNKIREIDFKE